MTEASSLFQGKGLPLHNFIQKREACAGSSCHPAPKRAKPSHSLSPVSAPMTRGASTSKQNEHALLEHARLFHPLLSSGQSQPTVEATRERVTAYRSG